MTGAMLIAPACSPASTELLLLFIGLELMVLPGYLLAGYHKTDAYSTEGAIKYFLLGSFSSAIFLFGLAFIWGMTGTTTVDGVADALSKIVAGEAPLSPGLAMGLAFLTTGVAFKIAAVPFHYWTPDAYQGSPDAGHRLPVGRPEGRRLRPDHPALRRGPVAARRRVAADHPRSCRR